MPTDNMSLSSGTWCSGITPAQHAGGPGFNPQCVHFCQVLDAYYVMNAPASKCHGNTSQPKQSEHFSSRTNFDRSLIATCEDSCIFNQTNIDSNYIRWFDVEKRRFKTWPRGVTVSTLDSESSDRGTNPREVSYWVHGCWRDGVVGTVIGRLCAAACVV